MSFSASAIELRHLRYFVAVFDELHFGRAAQRLHIAQPPLSRAIRRLERELGVQLLVRTSRAVEPTPAGDVFAEEARRVLANFDFAVTEARRTGQRGAAVRIGCTPYLPVRLLQRFLGALRERDADVKTQVTHLTGPEQLPLLRAGELDLGILTYAEDYEDLAWEALFPGEPLGVYLPQSHRLAGKDVLTPDDLADETRVIGPRAANPVVYDHFVALFDAAGYRFRALHESNLTDPRDLLLAVVGGLGVAFGPLSLEQMVEASGRVVLRRIDPELLMPDTIVAWRAKAPRLLQTRLGDVRSIARELFGKSLP